MLKTVRVEGIKGLRSTEYNLEKMNLLLGPSGSNKSALIEAIILGQSGTHPHFGSKGNEIMAIASDNPPTDRISVQLTYDQNGKEFDIRRVFERKNDKVSQTIYINGGKETQQEANKRIEQQVGSLPFAFDIPGFIFDKKKDEFLFNVFGDKITQIPTPQLRNMIKIAIIGLCEEYVSIVTYKYGIKDLQDLTPEKAIEIIDDFNDTMKAWSMKGVMDEIFSKLDRIPEGITIEEYCAKAYDVIDTHTNILSQELNIKKKSLQEDKDRLELIDIAEIERKLDDAKKERASMQDKIDKHKEDMNKHEQAVKLKKAYESSLEKVLTDEEIKETQKEIELIKKEMKELEKEEKDLLKLKDKLLDDLEKKAQEYKDAKKEEKSIQLTVEINAVVSNINRIKTREEKQKELESIKVAKKKDVAKEEELLKNLNNELAVEMANTGNLKEMKKAAKAGKCHVCKSKINITVESVETMISDNTKAIAVLKKKISDQEAKLRNIQEHNNQVDREQWKLDRIKNELETYKDVSGMNIEDLEKEKEAKELECRKVLDQLQELEAAEDKAREEHRSVEMELSEMRDKTTQKRYRLQEKETLVNENDQKKNNNAEKQKQINSIKIIDIQPFDETIIQYKETLDDNIEQYEEQRENVLGQKQIEANIKLKEQEALILEGQAKFSRIAEKEVKGFNNKLLDKVLGPIKDRASDASTKVFGYPVALDTQNCGLYIDRHTVRDIRALSGGERTILAIIILSAALEEVKTSEKLLIAEGAEMDAVYTAKVFDVLVDNDFNHDFIIASNKTNVEVREEVNVIRMG